MYSYDFMAYARTHLVRQVMRLHMCDGGVYVDIYMHACVHVRTCLCVHVCMYVCVSHIIMQLSVHSL